MLRFISLSISLMLSSSVLSVAQTLSPAEADAIIATQEQAQAERKAARLAEFGKAEVISEGHGVLPNGKEVIVRKVRPSDIEVEKAEVAEPTPQLVPTPEQIDAWQAEDAKQTEALMLSATVYDREVTRLSWTYESVKYVAYTNANFIYMRGVHSVETDTHRYSFFMGIGDAARNQNHYSIETIPLASEFSTGKSEYQLLQGDPNNKPALNGISALLRHYDANLESLIVAQQRREALKAAQLRYDAANPKEPEPFIMQFSVPEQKQRKASE